MQELCPECKFSLVFDEKIDGPVIETLFKTKENVIVEIDEDELSRTGDSNENQVYVENLLSYEYLYPHTNLHIFAMSNH